MLADTPISTWQDFKHSARLMEMPREVTPDSDETETVFLHVCFTIDDFQRVN